MIPATPAGFEPAFFGNRNSMAPNALPYYAGAFRCIRKLCPSQRAVMTASSMHSAVTAFTAAFPFKLQGYHPFIIEQHQRFELCPPGWWPGAQPLTPILHTIAVRTGIEPVATNRQFGMLAITPTNRLEKWPLAEPLISLLLHLILLSLPVQYITNHFYHEMNRQHQ